MSGKKQKLSFKNSPSSSSEESDSSSYESESVLAIGAQSSSDISSDSSESLGNQRDETDFSYKAVSQIPSYEIDQEAIRKKADKIGGWGYEKQTFYSSQLKEEAHSDDEQDINEMEKEAIKLQKARAGNFKSEDFGEIEKGDRTMLDALNQELNEIDLERIHFEKINKDISGFSNQEKLKYLVSQSPELLSLLMDLQKYTKEIQQRLDPKIKSLKKVNKLNNVDSFYQARYSKQSGVKNHPVIDQIVKQREIIKQMKKINDRLLKQEKEIASHNKKNKTTTKKITAKTNVKSKIEKKKNKIESEKVNKKSKKDSKAAIPLPSSESKSKSKSKPKTESSSDYNSESESEEEQFVRFSTSSSKQNNETIKKKEIGINSNTNREKRGFNGEDDDDNEINEENISKRARTNSYISNQDDKDESNDYYQQIEEQIKLKKQKEEKKKKKQKKKKKRRKGKTVSIIPEPDKIVKDGEKRNINYQILKNADLTKRINKKTRNPRIKRKLKYQKAMNKWKTKVGGYKKLKGSYSGESSGIKMNITRSIQFGGSRK